MIGLGPAAARKRAHRAPSPRRRLLVLAAACAAAWFAVALGAQYARTYALAREAARLDQHRRALIAENQALRKEIYRLNTDDGYIERLARKELGLVRPGEVELLLVAPGSRPSGAALNAGGPPPDTDTSRGAGTNGGRRAGAPAVQPAAQGVSGPGWLARLWGRILVLLAALRR